MLKSKKIIKTLPSCYHSLVSGAKDDPPLVITVDPNKNLTISTAVNPTPQLDIEIYNKHNMNTGENTFGAQATYRF